MRVLLSIKPEHVQNILAGEKTFEFRRKVFGRKDVRTVIIYCTMPVGRLVGEFDISEIIESDPENLWSHTQYGSGITKTFFDSYFEGRERAFAIKIGEVRAYERPIEPSSIFENFTAPQSFMYVDRNPGAKLADGQLDLL